MIHTVQSFSIVNKAEIDVCLFFWNSLVFSVIQQMLAIWSLVPLPFLKSNCTSGTSQFTYCWSLAWRILIITLLAYAVCLVAQLCLTLCMWNECKLYVSLNIVWHCLSLGLEWKLTFSSPVATVKFSKFAECFLRPTLLHTPGCLALGEWPHHCSYPGHQDLFL